jgi:opacity protein-like surface antigen
MKNGKTIMAALGLLAAAAGPAAAQDVRGVYLGASGFATMYEHSCENLIVPCDETSFGGRAFAGYRFSRYFSAEVGVASLGKAEASGTVGGVAVNSTVEVIPAWDVSGLVSFPIVGALEGFGRLGLFLARMKVDTNIGGVTEHIGDNSQGWLVGAGLQLNLGRLGLRLEWSRYDDVGGEAAFNDNVDAFAIGVLFRF